MTESMIGTPIEGFSQFSRKVAAEGAVLLKNSQAVLPLNKGENVAVFGRVQFDYYRSGTGSGGSVNVAYKTNLIDSLLESEQVNIDQDVLSTYKAWLNDHPFDDGGGGWAQEPWHQQEMPVDETWINEKAKDNDKAIVVIGRTAGEDQDNKGEAGSYYLTATEEALVKKVSSAFKKVAVVLNTSNIIDNAWLTLYDIEGLIYTWHGGMEGGRAASDVLLGQVNPSGKLPDTIAYKLSDYPAHKNFGSKTRNFYEEDIYVGYRYFETFKPDAVQFPFGFGLSYTTFEVTTEASTYSKESKAISLEVKVKNTGHVSGKETVQIYLEAPQGKLGQPSRRLVAFKKSALLEAGEEETLTFKVDEEQFATYDETGESGYASSYVLENGAYVLHVGTSVRETSRIELTELGFNVSETQVIKQCEEALRPVLPFKRLKPGAQQEDGTYEETYHDVPLRTIDLEKRIKDRMPKEVKQTPNTAYTLDQVKNNEVDLDAFVAQLSDDALATLVRGEGMVSPLVTPGTASAFGGVSDRLLALGLPVACTADGPSGIRMDSGHKATQVPIGTLLASTFDPELVEALYVYESRELRQNEIDLLLGPGVNIHRHPLNGRNFEYFSEDPYLTGIFAISNVRGIMSHGAHATPKHFACNSQEDARTEVDAVVSERALREIYLKGFEMAVKEADVKAIMTAYNPINGVWSASNYDLNTTLLRGEWDFDGIVMTDWWAKMNDPIEQGEAKKTHTDHMVRAQNDLYMVVDNYGAETNASHDETLAGIKSGKVTRAELQRSAKNICRFLLIAPVYGRKQVFRDHFGLVQAKDTGDQEGQRLSVDEKVNVENESQTIFKVTEPGDYRMFAELKATGKEMAQSATNIFLNEDHVATAQMNGSTDDYVSLKLPKVTLEKGDYTIKLVVSKQGIDLKALSFKKI